MRKNFVIGFIVILLISACGPSSPALPSEDVPTATKSPIPPTATEIPPTPTFPPTPTLALPVSPLTQVPSSGTEINSENAKSLKEVARYYGDINYSVKLTKDEMFLFILDPGGVTKYNYQSMEPMTRIELANSASNLQISNDGSRMIVDNNWLLDLRKENEPQQYELPDLLDFPAFIFTLSPDGSLIAAQRYNCSGPCNHELRIVSTDDFSIVHVSKGLSLQNNFAFSSNGAYFAVVDTFTQVDSVGNSSTVGGQASVWKTSDFTKVSSMDVRFPFRAYSLAFSEDQTMLAVAQNDFIDVFDVLSGELKVTIGNLCFSYQRMILFVPSSPQRLLEKSDCSSNIWTITGSNAIPFGNGPSDLSRIVLDNEGNFENIPFTYSTISEFKPYRQEYYFRFSNEDTLSFKSFDNGSLDRRTCDISLAIGSFDCQAFTSKDENGQILGKSRILAIDGEYYDYTVSKSTVDIYSSDNPGEVYYSIPFHSYGFELVALDPVNELLFYHMALSTNINRVVIHDMTTDGILQKWEGETFLSSYAFSENGKYAAFCRSIGYNTRPNKDKLILFDLAEKKIIYNETFTCSGVSLALSQNGNKLAVQQSYLKNPTDQRYSVRVLIMNTLPPYDKQYVDLEAASRAIVFSPDDSLLAVACAETDICFFDVATKNQVYQLKANSQITNLAFSPNGNFLAASSNWGLISLWAVPPFEN